MEQGKDTILLFQATDAILGASGYVLGNSTDNSYSIENDVIDEKTKFGRVVGYGANSESFEFTAYGDKNDPGQEAVLEAIRTKKQIKVWEVDLVLNGTGDHDALFAYGIVESVSKTAGDGFVEFSGTIQVYGSSVVGTVPALPAEVIAFATYGFEAPGVTTGEFVGITPTPAPTNLAAGTATSTTVPLTWTAVAGTGVTYRVYKNNVQVVADLTTTSYTVTGLTTATSYTFEVTAVINTIESVKSNTVTKSTL